jgi:biopolymer transport protein TolR
VAFGRLERNPGSKPMSEINMTPLIDVMLVLLVIFIISAPLMNARLALDLPQAEGASGANDVPAVLLVAVDAKGQLYLGDEPTTAALLTLRARATAQRQPLTEVQLRADERVPYGRVAEVIGLVQSAGLSRIGFITAPAKR